MRLLRCEGGQSAVEYLGVIVAAAVVVGVLLAAVPGVGQVVVSKVGAAIATLGGGGQEGAADGGGPPAAAPAPSSGGGESVSNSFTAETPVVMGVGSRRAISQVRVGDRVLAGDPTSGQVAPRAVQDVIVGEGQRTLVVVRAGGQTLRATDGHPFWVHDRGRWVDAADLRPGDRVLDPDGNTTAITSVTVQAPRHQRVYNLTVSGLHTYYAGHHPTLVHNTHCGGDDALGAGGVQTTSTTLLRSRGRGFRIDVENPAPGSRPGQLHLQDDAGGKYLYDFEQEAFQGLPRSLAKQVNGDPDVARAIVKGREYLNVPGP